MLKHLYRNELELDKACFARSAAYSKTTISGKILKDSL